MSVRARFVDRGQEDQSAALARCMARTCARPSEGCRQVKGGKRGKDDEREPKAKKPSLDDARNRLGGRTNRRGARARGHRPGSRRARLRQRRRGARRGRRVRECRRGPHPHRRNEAAPRPAERRPHARRRGARAASRRSPPTRTSSAASRRARRSATPTTRGGLLAGKLVEKCRYGALVVREDGAVVAVGFRKLWPAATATGTRRRRSRLSRARP